MQPPSRHLSVYRCQSGDQQPGGRPGFPSLAAQLLGGAQVAVGLACAVLNGVGIHYKAASSVSGVGFWAGAFFMVTGAIGINAGREKTTGWIIGFMVLSIVSATFFTLCLLTLSLVGISQDSDSSKTGTSEQRTVRMALNGFLAALAFLECLTAIVSSSICCGPLCCHQTIKPSDMTQLSCTPQTRYRGPRPSSMISSRPTSIMISSRPASILISSRPGSLLGSPTSRERPSSFYKSEVPSPYPPSSPVESRPRPIQPGEVEPSAPSVARQNNPMQDAPVANIVLPVPAGPVVPPPSYGDLFPETEQKAS